MPTLASSATQGTPMQRQSVSMPVFAYAALRDVRDFVWSVQVGFGQSYDTEKS
jgi:hypothetical protein